MTEYIIAYGAIGGGAAGLVIGTAVGVLGALKLDSMIRRNLTKEEAERLKRVFERRDDLPDPVTVEDFDSTDDIEETIGNLDDLSAEEQREIMEEIEKILNGESRPA